MKARNRPVATKATKGEIRRRHLFEADDAMGERVIEARELRQGKLMVITNYNVHIIYY